jgi:SAM-dependent methyltransferase
MNEQLTECPLCNGKKFELFLKCKDYTVSNDIFEIKSCLSCGFKFTSPRPDMDSIGKYYESQDYISHSNTKVGFINKLYHIIRSRSINKKTRFIENFKLTKKNILDIGCGTGSFLGAMKAKGWNVLGVEPNSKARKSAIDDFGIKVVEKLEQNTMLSHSFSVITMWHVLEHVHSLKDKLREIQTLLEENGIVVIAVPNYTSWDAKHYNEKWAAYDVPRHLYHFSPISIKSFFSEYGLQHIQSIPMKYDSYYVSLLSEKYKNSGAFIPLKAFIYGFISNSKAGTNAEKYSSVIYIFKKN